MDRSFRSECGMYAEQEQKKIREGSQGEGSYQQKEMASGVADLLSAILQPSSG
jgi:hypothetical protein